MSDTIEFVCDRCKKECESLKTLTHHKKVYCRLRDKGTPNQLSNEKSHLKCFKCGIFGHSVKSCKLH